MWDVFLLGLAGGLAVMTVAACRRVFPRWLMASLLACGALVATRYVALAAAAPQVTAWRGALWQSGMIGMSWPAIAAVDQLVRHPAMTPTRLLQWYLPFLLTFGLTMPWPIAASIAQGLFAVAFIGVCAWLIRKLPSQPIRLALAGLAVGQAGLVLSGLCAMVGGWKERSLLVAEMLMWLALWHAFETAHQK